MRKVVPGETASASVTRDTVARGLTAGALSSARAWAARPVNRARTISSRRDIGDPRWSRRYMGQAARLDQPRARHPVPIRRAERKSEVTNPSPETRTRLSCDIERATMLPEVSHGIRPLTGRVAKPRVTANDRRDQEADNLCQATNLIPRTTGLPLTAWVSPRGRARHDARISVSLTPGRMDIGHTAVVGIRSSPRLIEGNLAPAGPESASQWIRLNEAALMDFRNETINSVKLDGRLKRI